jgi:hypothetical protein
MSSSARGLQILPAIITAVVKRDQQNLHLILLFFELITVQPLNDSEKEQVAKSQGWEGWFTPARLMPLDQSGGKPPFPTLRFSILNHVSAA